MKFQAAMKTGTGLVTWRDLPRDKRYQMWFLSSSKPAESQAPRWLQIWKKMIESNVMNLWFTLSSNKNCERKLGTKNLSQQGPPWFSAAKRHRRLGFDGKDSSNKLPKCLEQVDGVPPPNGWNVLQHPAVRVPETWIRDFGIHFSTFYTTSLAFREIFEFERLVCQRNRFHLFLFVCPFHLSGNYSNHTNHLLSTCSRCHWSGPGNGWKDRFKSWSAFFHPEFPCKPDKSSSNPPPIQLLPLEQFQKKQKSGEIV